MTSNIYFHNWESILRILTIGILAYPALIMMLRISGKRTLLQMKEFDFIVTVALGSTLTTVLLNKYVSLIEGLTALSLLILLQYIIAALSVRSTRFSNFVSFELTLLFFSGTFLKKAMIKERVTEDEVRSVIRSQGFASLEEVEAVVMESNGQFSVVTKGSIKSSTSSSLSNVKNFNR